MLSKEEKRNLNRTFWDGFKEFMRGNKSTNGKKINWINYPSDIKGIFIRMELTTHSASLCMDLQFHDPGVREIVWEQLHELKKLLESHMQYPTLWQEDIELETGKTIHRLKWEKHPIHYLSPKDVPIIYNFLHDRLIEFDSFYQEYKDILITLVK
jgi:hypothetical protein